MADGCRVPPVGLLVDRLVADWGRPKVILCDRFRMDDLQDALPPCPVSPRVTRWSEAAAAIRDLRKLVLDEGLSVEPVSRDLLTASLAVATVKNDDQGNARLVKRSQHNKVSTAEQNRSKLRIPMKAATDSDGKRPPVPIQNGHFGRGSNWAS